MGLGNKLLELRKSKNLSQEEVADKLNVTRQTISKWETDQSTPDFDKLKPLCDLYDISSDELLSVTNEPKNKTTISKLDEATRTKKKAQGICLSILIYFIAIAWITVSIAGFNINPLIATAIFILICGIATYIIIYTGIVYKKESSKEKELKETNPVFKQVEKIVSLITLIIYLFVSFATMAWHITWIIWVVYGLVMEIIKLIFSLDGGKDE